MNRHFKYVFSLFICFIYAGTISAQNNDSKDINYIKTLIQSDSITKAKIELDVQINYLKSQKAYDSLIKYFPLYGNLKLINNNSEIGINKAKRLFEFIKQSNITYLTKAGMLELAWLYDDFGKPKTAYNITKEALEIALKIKDKKLADIEGIEYTLGIRARDFGDMNLSKRHLLNALKIRLKTGDEDHESYYSIYNGMGAVMWYSAKLDSAQYYFREALKALEKMDSIPLNKYYRPAIVQNNISVLAHGTGDIEKAIDYCAASINNYNRFITTTNDDSRKTRAKKFALSSTDNLGAFYNSIGEYNRADDLISYSYNEKLKIFDTDSPDILISLIILGQSKISIKDYKKAGYYLDKAINIVETKPDTQLYWSSTAYSSRASVYKEEGNLEKASAFYEKGEAIFRTSLGSDYSKAFLDNIIVMSTYFSEIGDYKKALKLSTEAYNFIKQSDYKNTLQEFHHVLSLAEVYFAMKNYKNALEYSNEALSVGIKNMSNASLKDSIHIQLNKPKAILLNAKVNYFLTEDKSELFLIKLSESIDKAVQILEQRKSIVKSNDDLNLLLSEHRELFDFYKKINLELYNKTDHIKYLNKTIQLHESSVYNRIRARLNIRNNAIFSNIPETVIKREKSLKNNLSKVLNDTKDIEQFINANKKWSVFLDSLKTAYPKYHKMRYATIAISLNDIQRNIPKDATVIRFFYTNEQLHAYVLNNQSQKLFKLNYKFVKNHLGALEKDPSQLYTNSDILFDLYEVLWKPFANEITTKNVIIIPDGALYNLSFETLTPTKVESFKDLTTNSLLAKYNMSYNYSLYLLEKNKNSVKYKNSFVAFAPEFNDKMKDNYKLAVTDSIHLDKTYLTLLQQPFNVDLAKIYANTFDGNYFINENSTEQVFKQNANEHKIIHIGTHAESNNISPELSRLIFAKSNSDQIDDGSLYTYEIYNTSLNSNLAILTACETGKPTFQAGEGMISLAHAFNYAGSESILTSLWKVDERSSSEIIESFYKNIKDGKPKDEALRLAKLHYIKNTEGRTLAPKFWAGLVLMGDASPIEISSGTPLWQWMVIFGCITLGILVLLRLRKN